MQLLHAACILTILDYAAYAAYSMHRRIALPGPLQQLYCCLALIFSCRACPIHRHRALLQMNGDGD
jgi:hypothetical protein